MDLQPGPRPYGDLSDTHRSLGISEELRRYRFLQRPDMKKQLENFSQDLSWPKRKMIIKTMVILCAASFFSAVGHFPIQVILTSTQCPATLGHASLTILYASLAISSQLSHITLRYLSPKVSLLCGIASHLVFNLANVYPSYETLIPASVISGVGNGVLWHAQSNLVSSLALRYSFVENKDLHPPTLNFRTVFAVVHEAAFLTGNILTSSILHISKTNKPNHMNILPLPSASLATEWHNRTCATWHSTFYHCAVDIDWLESMDTLFYSYTACIAAGFMLVFLGVLSPDVIFRQIRGPSVTLSPQTSRVIRRMSPAFLSAYYGLHQAFVLGDITKLVSSTYGIHMVGLAMSCYGVARLPWSFLSCSRWRKITESQQFCVLGCTLLLACYVFTFSTALKQPSTPIIAYTVLFWGFTDGLSQQLIAGVCQKYSIKSHIGTRYTSFRSLGLAVGLGAAPFLCPVYRLYALTLGILVYTLVCPCSQKLCTQKQTSSADV